MARCWRIRTRPACLIRSKKTPYICKLALLHAKCSVRHEVLGVTRAVTACTGSRPPRCSRLRFSMQQQQQRLPRVLVILPALWVVLPVAQTLLAKAVSLVVHVGARWRKPRPCSQQPASGTQPAATRSSTTQSLQQVVTQCEARWLLESLQVALQSGCPTAMHKVQQMMEAGFGAKQDPQALSDWAQQAWSLQNMRMFKNHGDSPLLQQAGAMSAATQSSAWPTQASRMLAGMSTLTTQPAMPVCAEQQEAALAGMQSTGTRTACQQPMASLSMPDGTAVPLQLPYQLPSYPINYGQHASNLQVTVDDARQQQHACLCRETCSQGTHSSDACTAPDASGTSLGDASGKRHLLAAHEGSGSLCVAAVCSGLSSWIDSNGLDWFQEPANWSDVDDLPPDDPDDSNMDDRW